MLVRPPSEMETILPLERPTDRSMEYVHKVEDAVAGKVRQTDHVHTADAAVDRSRRVVVQDSMLDTLPLHVESPDRTPLLGDCDKQPCSPSQPVRRTMTRPLCHRSYLSKLSQSSRLVSTMRQPYGREKEQPTRREKRRLDSPILRVHPMPSPLRQLRR